MNLNKPINTNRDIDSLDTRLSNRSIELDPNGYFLIKIDLSEQEIVVEHFSNDINEQGIAIDPSTGEPIKCSGGTPRKPTKVYRGRSAKEIGIKLTEGGGPYPLTKLDHALYLGRELQKAESCLKEGVSYVQD